MVEMVGIKCPYKNKNGKVIGYVLKKDEELEEELMDRLARGERLVKVAFEPFEGYLEHLAENGIPHKVAKTKNSSTVAVVEITPNFKRYDGVIGISESFYRIEDHESLDDVVEYIAG